MKRSGVCVSRDSCILISMYFETVKHMLYCFVLWWSLPPWYSAWIMNRKWNRRANLSGALIGLQMTRLHENR